MCLHAPAGCHCIHRMNVLKTMQYTTHAAGQLQPSQAFNPQGLTTAQYANFRCMTQSGPPPQLRATASALAAASMHLSSACLNGAGMRAGFTGGQPGSSPTQVASPSATTCCSLPLLDSRTTRSLNCKQTAQKAAQRNAGCFVQNQRMARRPCRLLNVIPLSCHASDTHSMPECAAVTRMCWSCCMTHAQQSATAKARDMAALAT